MKSKKKKKNQCVHTISSNLPIWNSTSTVDRDIIFVIK
jgi:hypothetical protein